MNFSNKWLATVSEQFSDSNVVDLFAPRRVFLDAQCEVFALVSAVDYEFATQWRWKWNWDRTKTKRYAIRTTRGPGRTHKTFYLHKEILNRSGKKQPTEAHTIGDHQDGESLNCQRENLEWATKSQNRLNRKR